MPPRPVSLLVGLLLIGASLGLPGGTSNAAGGGTTTLISVNLGGKPGALRSEEAEISANGRYVSFASQSTHLVAGDNDGITDIFRRDLITGVTVRVSVPLPGQRLTGPWPLSPDWDASSISEDGRYVAFVSSAGNLVEGVDTHLAQHLYLRDIQSGTTSVLDVTPRGTPATKRVSGAPRMTPDGRYVVFRSDSDDLVAGDHNQQPDVFVRDRQTGTTRLASLTSTGAAMNDVDSAYQDISADGRTVAFTATQGDHPHQVFVKDLETGRLELVSAKPDGSASDGVNSSPVLSADGRRIGWSTFATDIVPGTSGELSQVVLRDRASGSTSLISVSPSGVTGNDSSYTPSLSRDGQVVVFTSAADNLVAGDSNGVFDVFRRDLRTLTTTRISVGPSGAQGPRDSSNRGVATSADGNSVAFLAAGLASQGEPDNVWVRRLSSP